MSSQVAAPESLVNLAQVVSQGKTEREKETQEKTEIKENFETQEFQEKIEIQEMPGPSTVGKSSPQETRSPKEMLFKDLTCLHLKDTSHEKLE
jgi:hypothetical protein